MPNQDDLIKNVAATAAPEKQYSAAPDQRLTEIHAEEALLLKQLSDLRARKSKIQAVLKDPLTAAVAEHDRLKAAGKLPAPQRFMWSSEGKLIPAPTAPPGVYSVPREPPRADKPVQSVSPVTDRDKELVTSVLGVLGRR